MTKGRRITKTICNIYGKEMQTTKYVSDVLTVSFEHGLKDESALCITRKLGEKSIILKIELGEQADILYRLLTEQMTKAEIKIESEEEKMTGEGEMSRLDETISDVAFILDNLMLLRKIQSTGDCNICANKNCEYEPKIGQMVRYNCPFYKVKSEDK